MTPNFEDPPAVLGKKMVYRPGDLTKRTKGEKMKPTPLETLSVGTR